MLDAVLGFSVAAGLRFRRWRPRRGIPETVDIWYCYAEKGLKKISEDVAVRSRNSKDVEARKREKKETR